MLNIKNKFIKITRSCSGPNFKCQVIEDNFFGKNASFVKVKLSIVELLDLAQTRISNVNLSDSYYLELKLDSRIWHISFIFTMNFIVNSVVNATKPVFWEDLLFPPPKKWRKVFKCLDLYNNNYKTTYLYPMTD